MAGAVDPLLGMRLLDRYEIQQCIGCGGMSRVYRARQVDLDREVAVKLLARASSDPARHVRLRAEAQALARLEHPNTVRVYELGIFNNMPILVMELLRGRTLERELEEHGPLPERRALKIVVQLCNSLEEAHRAGVIHGDVKPQNVFLTDIEGSTDFVKLVDFLVARLSSEEPDEERYLGTPAYMSPEWLGGGTASRAADVYACGVIAFQMLTGRLPSPSRAETIRALLGHASDGVTAIVLRAMEASPTARYPSVAELRRHVDRELKSAFAPMPASSLNRERRARQKHGWSEPPPGLRPRLAARIPWPNRIEWSPDGCWLAVTQDRRLHLLEIESGRMSTFFGGAGESDAWQPETVHVVGTMLLPLRTVGPLI
jgi:serine/threonine protein kinase